jgi:hypothetical protein
MKATDILHLYIPVQIPFRPLSYFTHISMTSPVVRRLRLEKPLYLELSLEVPTDFLNRFWIQVTVSIMKRPLRNRFRIETVTNL